MKKPQFGTSKTLQICAAPEMTATLKSMKKVLTADKKINAQAIAGRHAGQ